MCLPSRDSGRASTSLPTRAAKAIKRSPIISGVTPALLQLPICILQFAFVAIDDEVVGLGAHLTWVAVEAGQILIHRCREWMMVRRPALLFFVPGEEREVEHPGDAILGLVGVVQLQGRRQVGAQVAQRL